MEEERKVGGGSGFSLELETRNCDVNEPMKI